MQHRFLIALGADGVLFDFESAWRKCAENILRRDIPKVSDHRDLARRFALQPGESNRVWANFHKKTWGNIEAYSYAEDMLYELKRLGCEIAVVTAVEGRAAEMRRRWLIRARWPISQLVSVSPHHHPAQAKASAVRELNALAFLEDDAENANAATHPLVSALLWRGCTGMPTPEHHVVVIDDPMDFPVLVETILQRRVKKS